MHCVHVLIKKKDVLEDLLLSDKVPYLNIFPKTRGGSKISMAKTILTRNFKLMKYCLKQKPNLLIGTSVENSHIGKLLGIPSINVNEDDHNVVPLYSQLSYPLSNTILSPTSCVNGRWEHKTIHYEGFHELAYLHPDIFTPNLDIVEKYFNPAKPYFLIRFAKLNAHHDKGIEGISNKMAHDIIKLLEPHGNVYISSEKPLPTELAKYALNVQARDIHHIMAFAALYIGDSQTMAAESAILGTPFFRCNDFVGKIGYLNELEHKYKLGFGIRPKDSQLLFPILSSALKNHVFLSDFGERHESLISEKINLTEFLIWFISNFPKSKSIMMQSPSFQNRFKSKLSYTSTNITPVRLKLSRNYRDRIVI